MAGAVLALLGCLAGNVLTLYLMVAKESQVPLLQVVRQVPFGQVLEALKAGFSPIDFLFYAIAVYEGYRFSFRPLNEGDLARLKRS